MYLGFSGTPEAHEPKQLLRVERSTIRDMCIPFHTECQRSKQSSVATGPPKRFRSRGCAKCRGVLRLCKLRFVLVFVCLGALFITGKLACHDRLCHARISAHTGQFMSACTVKTCMRARPMAWPQKHPERSLPSRLRKERRGPASQRGVTGRKSEMRCGQQPGGGSRWSLRRNSSGTVIPSALQSSTPGPPSRSSVPPKALHTPRAHAA